MARVHEGKLSTGSSRLGCTHLKYLCSAHYLSLPGMGWSLFPGHLEVIDQNFSQQLLIAYKVRSQTTSQDLGRLRLKGEYRMEDGYDVAPDLSG